MDRNVDYTLLYRVAKAYFVDQRTQQEIADIENFSRSQISRMLKKAVEEKLVRYTLDFPAQPDEQALSQQLREKLGLHNVVLIPSFYGSGAVSPDQVSKNLAIGAAERLAELLGDAKTVGLGWGRTMYNTSLYVRPSQKSVKGRVFIPLIGLSGDNNPVLQINTIVDRFGERFRADRYYVNMASLQNRQDAVSSAGTPVAALRQKWEELDAAVVGIGVGPANNKNLISEFPKAYKRQIQSAGTVGDILSQFYYEDGSILELDSNFRLLALDIRALRKVPNVIAVASGREKCLPIITAAKMGFMNSLITDYDTGINLINFKGENL